ncbi:MAG: tetratricopeptide repeat protein [Sandaracinaceae bacterium]|nr:tetratricopeptide repeat protein [Sandaracinaceae bacterium]
MMLDPTHPRSDRRSQRPGRHRAPRERDVLGVSTTLLLLSLAMSVTPQAQAQRGRRRLPPEAVAVPGEASQHAAHAAFVAGDFAEAERLYEQAFSESASPVMLVGLADARERQGNAAGAVEALERYLALRPDAPDQSAVTARVAALRALRGVVLVTAEPPGEVWLDGERTGYVTPVELTLPPGQHGIAVTLRGELVGEHAVEVPFGGRTTLALVEGAPVPEPVEGAEQGDTAGGGEDALGTPAVEDTPDATAEGDEGAQSDAVSLEGDGVPLTEPEETATPDAPSRYEPRRAAAISAGVAAGTLVMGTVLGFMALTEQSNFDEHPSDRAADRGERLALFSDVMFGVAGIAAVTSVVLYVTDRRAARQQDAEASRLRLTPLAGRRGAGFGAVLQF